MKHTIPFILLAILLTGCGLIPTAAVPTQSDSELATKVSQLLTAQPTLTSAAAATPTARLVAPSASPEPSETPSLFPTQAPTITNTPLPATSTSTVTVTPTATLKPTNTTSGPTATLTANDPKTRLGTPDYKDAMTKSSQWPVGQDDYVSLTFKDDKMALKGLSNYYGWRLTFPKISNVYLEETVTTGSCSGLDAYGLIFRAPDLHAADRGYILAFSCDGKYTLLKWDGTAGDKGVMTTLIDWKANNAIKSGSNQTNRLGVMMIDNRLILYANGVLLGEKQDSTYSEGYFGVVISARVTTDFTVQVSEIDYWNNPTP